MECIVKLSVSNICFPNDSHVKYHKLLCELGIKHIEIAPSLVFKNSENCLRPSVTEKKKFSDSLNLYGLTLVSMQSILYGKNCESFFKGVEERKNFINLMRTAIELASELEIPNIVFGCPKERLIPNYMNVKTALDIASNVFWGLGNYAKTLGTTIGIETIPEIYNTNFLNRHSATSNFVRALGHPNVRITFDLGAYECSQSKVTLAEIVSEDFQLINHIHLSKPYLAPYNKNFNLITDLFQLLNKFRYEKACSLEQSNNLSNVEFTKSVDNLVTKFRKINSNFS